ncbi:TolC family protein [Pseudenhygromyxa sp. WMMC2535]|uniref:TolC family protein n=1 Tax=Pseudenhygromyxa sp. WMMC2535 TaxID=2712867 RepID=UPI0015962482|nr:TolC family protein [Pseudenhygromyxa sp. WMMC2535]NVB38547.1 TolC family protein [Pseudenhygromyxa sp. WMMC2535]
MPRPLVMLPSLLLATLLPATLLAAPPSDQPADRGEPPADLATQPSDGVVEGPAPVPEYDDPIVAALQPVPGGLTADEVARRTVEQSPNLVAKQAEVDVAKAQLDQTLYQFIPHIEGTASYTRLSQAYLDFGLDELSDTEGYIVGALNEGPLSLGPCTEGSPFQCVIDSGGIPVGAAPFEFDFEISNPPLNAFSLQATLGVPISDYIARLPTAKKGGEAQIRAAEYAAEAETLTIQKDARLAYYDWVRAIASTVALQESLERTQARLEDAEASFEAGLMSKADVMRLDAAVASLTAASIRADNFQRVAAQYLATMMGEEGFPSYQIGEDLFTDLPPLEDAEDLEQMLEEAVASRREFKAFDASVETLDYGIKTTRAGYYPRLDGFAEATYANPNQRFFPLEAVWNGSWSAGLSLTFVVNDAIQTKAKVNELQAQRRSLEAQRENLRRGVTLEVASAHAERQSTLAELEHIQRARESAAEGYRVAVDLYQVGDATTTDILDAEYEQVDATLRAINAEIDLRVADITLAYALGREPLETSDQ